MGIVPIGDGISDGGEDTTDKEAEVAIADASSPLNAPVVLLILLAEEREAPERGLVVALAAEAFTAPVPEDDTPIVAGGRREDRLQV